MRVALAQINPTVGDLSGNKQKVISFIKKAKSFDADIVVFPELVISGYPPQDLMYKEHFIKNNIKTLNSIVKGIKGITAIVGFVDTDRQKNIYNAAAVISDGKLKGVYHKQELPNYGVFDEKRYFKKGGKAKSFSLKGVKFGLSICEDIWIDNGPCKLQAKSGAKVIFNISSSPYDLGKLKERESLLKKRAKETRTFICYTNLVGGQDELVFDGGSIIVDPGGNIVASGKLFEEDLVVYDLPLLDVKKKKDLCSSNTKHLFKKINKTERIYKALVLGTRDYIKKNGFEKVVIGLSGGIDSALVATIAADAIGSANVIGISMPSRYTSKSTKSDASKFAKNLGIDFKEIAIEDTFKVYLKTLACDFKGKKSDITEENIQARIRGNILMALSNKFGWIVLTTGNKSETAVGYCTLYGDMSGGFAVIKDLLKTKVYELAKMRNAIVGTDIILKSIIERAPTAELRNNQKDQDTLPPYDVLDDILVEYIEKHKSVLQITKNKYSRSMVEDVISKVDRSEYKRRQAPPGIKITQRSFDKDWRLPITNKYKGF
ncbi:MAG: NAD+ synthase [Candidatus Zapsychrus exili]|nr:NAD+ synthase [Candidatus Zapsychrus exili]